MIVDIKSGIKTSEFYVTLLAIVIVSAGELVDLKLDVVSVSAVASSAIAYVVSRIIAKRKKVA